MNTKSLKLLALLVAFLPFFIMASSLLFGPLLFGPLFLILPAPIKALMVVAAGFLFFGVESKQEKVQEARPAIEAPAQAE